MRSKKTQQLEVKSQLKTSPKASWYVLRAFKKDNKAETGFLSISKSKSSNGLYEVVESLVDASEFPSLNVYKTKGFGTPKQWLEFFRDEPTLSAWDFHLVKLR